MCYAKITPAALHRGEFRGRRREGAEAAGINPKFEMGDSQRRIRGDLGPVQNHPAWQHVEQIVPLH